MIDVFICIVLLWAAWSGWRAGVVKELVSSLGFLVGLLAAALLYESFGEYLAVDGSESNMFTSLVAFFLLWIAVPIVLGLVANILTKCLKGMRLGMPNSILGALVGAVKYLLLLSCVFHVMGALHILNEDRTKGSVLYGPVQGVVAVFLPADSTATGRPERVEERADTVWVPMHQGGRTEDPAASRTREH